MKTGRKKIFDGRIFSVFKEEKTLPDGKKAYFEEVVHSGAALIVPFAGNRVVFLRQYRCVIGRYIWELPAGTLEKGETPYACAKREITEETGYAVKKLTRLGMIYTTPGFCNERIYIYRAECGKRGTPCLDAEEYIKIKHFTRREIRVLFKKGKINDSKTIAALSYAGVL